MDETGNDARNLNLEYEKAKKAFANGEISEEDLNAKKNEILNNAFGQLEPGEKLDSSEYILGDRFKEEWKLLSRDILGFWVPLVVSLLLGIPIVYWMSTSALKP